MFFISFWTQKSKAKNYFFSVFFSFVKGKFMQIRFSLRIFHDNKHSFFYFRFFHALFISLIIVWAVVENSLHFFCGKTWKTLNFEFRFCAGTIILWFWIKFWSRNLKKKNFFLNHFWNLLKSLLLWNCGFLSKFSRSIHEKQPKDWRNCPFFIIF